MSLDDTVIDNPESVKNNFEYDQQMKKIREEIAQKLGEYKRTILYLAADAPISVLCLSSAIEKALSNQGLFRIYDLFDCDFTKIKGLGVIRIGELTASLDKFFSML